MIKHESANWYAVQTRARNEKVVCERLQEQGLDTFLPLVTEVRRWSDRKKKVELPLFSCYVFVKLTFTNSDERMRVYRTSGVFRIVSMRGEAVPIPDEQIDALRTVVTQQVALVGPSFSEDRTASAHSRRFTRRGRRRTALAQWRSHADYFRRRDPALFGGERRRLRRRSALSFNSPQAVVTSFVRSFPPLVENSMESAQILLVSKERSARDLDWIPAENPGWQLETAGSGWEALERVHAGHGPDLIVLDLMRGDSEGLHTLRWLRRVRPDLPVVVLASSEDAGSEAGGDSPGSPGLSGSPAAAGTAGRCHPPLALL